MKLLEIIAEEWEKWPEDVNRVFQYYNGDIVGAGNFGYKRFLETLERADDYETAVVTEAKWKLKTYEGE